MSTRVVILAILCLAIGHSAAEKRTVNVQGQFLRWPNPKGILYYIDSTYTPQERSLIIAAINKFQSDTVGCIQFVQTTAADPSFKLKITPLAEDNLTPAAFCQSYAGFYSDLQRQGRNEQRVVIARGPTGCLDGSLRGIMKYLAITVGKRNEHQRGDRDSYIQVDQSAILPNILALSNPYRVYTSAEAYWQAFEYDYCSITHNRETDLSLPGRKAFSVLRAPFFIPALDQLSNTDCQLINMMYNCPTRFQCAPLNCAAQIPAATTISPAQPSSTPGLPPVPTGRPTNPPQPATSQPPVPATNPPLPTAPPTAAPPPPTSTAQPPLPTFPPVASSTAQPPVSTSGPASGSTIPPVFSGSSTDSSTLPPVATSAAPLQTSTEPDPPCNANDFSNFCGEAPTVSLLYQTGATTDQDTYIAVVGKCAMSYIFVVDSGIQVLKPQAVAGLPNPAPLTSFYPNIANFISYPIGLSYIANPTTGTTFHTLTNPASLAMATVCDVDYTNPAPPSQSGGTCSNVNLPSTPQPGQLATAVPNLTGGATSVTSNQFYVYDPASNQLCASNSPIVSAPLPASQCLTLNNGELQNMATVTSIQFNGFAGANSLVFFGEDANGVPVIAIGDVPATQIWTPTPQAPTLNTYGGAFPLAVYTRDLNCPAAPPG